MADQTDSGQDAPETPRPPVREQAGNRPEGSGPKLKRAIIHGGFEYAEGEKAPDLSSEQTARLKRIGAL
jgi:hypothetical protein